jgi:glycosyltransferase involved in cell wall biosynthesis
MRVLHVISGDLWAGAEVQAYTLLTTLQNISGMEVAVALMNDGELAERLRYRAIPITILPERDLGTLTIAYRLRTLMLEWRPHLVHTHRLKENILGSLVNAASLKVPSLRTVHGAREHFPRGVYQLHKRAIVELDRFCGRHLQRAIIAVSHELAKTLEAEYPPESIVVIENGVDIDAVRSQVHQVEFRAVDPQCTHVGLVGRLVRVKRPDLFIETAALLRSTHPERKWRFHIFGDGPLRERLVEQTRALALDDITKFHGHRRDIVACMAALDILVICSDHEGLPMSLLESLVVGTPVVAHAVGGMTDLISDSSGGRAVRLHSPAGYAAAIIDALNQKPREVQPELQAHIALRYSAQRNARSVQAVYQRLAGDTAP